MSGKWYREEFKVGAVKQVRERDHAAAEPRQMAPHTKFLTFWVDRTRQQPKASAHDNLEPKIM